MKRLLHHWGRPAAVATVLAAVLVAVAGPGGGGANAQPPDEYGWWSRFQVPPGPPATLSAPPGPVVPDDGLFVATDTLGAVPSSQTGGGLESARRPTAYAAVRVEVPEDSLVTLTLDVADGYTADPATLVDACVPTSSWDRARNGRLDEGPTYDCVSTFVTGEVEENGTRISWTLGPEFVAADGFTYDVVLVPDGSVRPFAVAFKAPDGKAVQIEGGAVDDGSDVGSDSGAGLDDPGTGGESAGGSDDGFGGGDGSGSEAFGGGAFGGTAGETIGETGGADPGELGADPGRAGRSASGPGVVGQRSTPIASIADPRTPRVMAVLLLLAMATGLWWFGSRPVRAPHLLGAAPGTDPPAGPDIGGIGRFARPRPDPPRRL